MDVCILVLHLDRFHKKYKDERRDVSFDRLPICRGDGDATVELALQEQNPVHLFYFFGSVDSINRRYSHLFFMCVKVCVPIGNKRFVQRKVGW